MGSEKTKFDELKFQAILNHKDFAKFANMSVNDNIPPLEIADNKNIEEYNKNSELEKTERNEKDFNEYRRLEVCEVESSKSIGESESDSAVPSSPGSSSSCSFVYCSSPDTCSPTSVSPAESLNSICLQASCDIKNILTSPLTSSDSGIADAEDSICKINSSTDDSVLDEEHFGHSNDEDKLISTDEECLSPVEVVEIYEKDETEFWFPSDDCDDYELYTQPDFNQCQYDQLSESSNKLKRNSENKMRSQRKKLQRGLIEAEDEIYEEYKTKRDEDRINFKLKWARHNVYKNTKMLQKANIEEAKRVHDRFCPKGEKKKLARISQREKKMIKILLKKEAQAMNFYSMPLSKKYNCPVLSNYFC